MNKKDNNTSHASIYNDFNIFMLKDIPALEDGQIYIYVMLNYPQGNIKIGKTTNIYQRFISLSGSNGGGSKITEIYCSPATWMQSVEGTCHNHYHYARISGTEWFDGRKVKFNEVVEYIDGLFHSESFDKCNELRKKVIENEKKRIKNIIDN